MPEPAIHPPAIDLNLLDPIECAAEGNRLYSTLNTQQKTVADTILSVLDDPYLPRLFHLDGPGGSGKTYLYKTLHNIFVGKGLKVDSIDWVFFAQYYSLGGLHSLDRNRCESPSRRSHYGLSLQNQHQEPLRRFLPSSTRQRR